LDDWNVYIAFRNAQSIAKGKGFRPPKDWQTFKETKMSASNRVYLDAIVNNFNTKWHNIDLNKYMQTGFELWKNFSYHQFQDPRVMEMYKRKATVHMRKMRISKETVIESMKHIKKYMEDRSTINGYNKLETYCKLKDGNSHIAYQDYIKGKLDNLTMAFLMVKRYLKLTDTERGNITVFIQNYRELVDEMLDIKKFIEKAESMI
jgi:hypothetical protein